jgi:hypothetical protein
MSLPAEAGGPRPNRQRPAVARSGLALIGGVLATATAVTLAAILTLVFAATLVVAAVLSGALIAVYALTHRRQPQGVLIEARRVGHTWVPYGWDQRPR